jgi:hypothetical protein
MKHTICGFSQEFAMTLRETVERDGKPVEIRVDCTDLVILRWFVDFYPMMNKMNIDGKEYAFLSHSYLMEQLPILDITKKSCIARMKKLVELGVLEYRLVKPNGNMSVYGFGEKYAGLVLKRPMPVEAPPCPVDHPTLVRSTDQPLDGQPDNINNTIIYSSISNSSYIPPLYSPHEEKPGTRAEEDTVKIVRHKYGEYGNVLLSDPELEKLQGEFPADWQERIEKLSVYMASTGKHYKNHLATIRSWNRMDKERKGQKSDGWDYIQAVAEGRAE